MIEMKHSLIIKFEIWTVQCLKMNDEPNEWTGSVNDMNLTV